MSKKEHLIFWNTASSYLDHYLKDIRQLSHNTVKSYRDSLNHFIDYLEKYENIDRRKVTFKAFKKGILQKYQSFMIDQKLAPKTCNLRITAIRAFLEYASQEYMWITPMYADACNIRNIKIAASPIEYFESDEMKNLLNAPSKDKKSDRRNRMILVFLYDTAARVSEAKCVRISDLHLDASIPYVTVLGKGRKYRNIPLMEKTIIHLKQYIKEFHNNGYDPDSPLFYSKTNGRISELSSDTFEKMIRKYAETCRHNGLSMPTNVHCHMIRKTRAMDLYRAGVPLTHIQQLLGHENISTTTGFYAFATLDVLSEAINSVHTDTEDKCWENSDVLDKLYRL